VTQDQKTTAAATIADVVGVRNRLRAVVFGILLGVLAQARSARVAMDYVDAVLGDVAANCWALAEAAGHDSPRRMQSCSVPKRGTGRSCGLRCPASPPRTCHAPAMTWSGPGWPLTRPRTTAAGTFRAV
jgi:hypothetical protein